MDDIAENKITRAVIKLNVKLAPVNTEGLDRMRTAAKLDVTEYIHFGDKPSRMMLMGILTESEAQTMHSIHSRYNDGASLAEQIVFLQVMQEALPTLKLLESRRAVA